MSGERGLLIRCIVTFYAVGVGTFAADLAACEARRPGSCDSSRGRLEGAIYAGPTALLALLVKSSPIENDAPSNPSSAAPSGGRARKSDDELEPPVESPGGVRGR